MQSMISYTIQGANNTYTRVTGVTGITLRNYTLDHFFSTSVLLSEYQSQIFFLHFDLHKKGSFGAFRQS